MHQRATVRAEARLSEVKPALPVQQLPHLDKAHDIVAIRADLAERTFQQADDHQAGHNRHRKDEAGVG